jgi:hypothetical protein
MRELDYHPILKLLTGLALLVSFSLPAVASVKYRFVITEQPAGNFFKPMYAEMVLSDAAVAAGQASRGQIESLVIHGGSAMVEEASLTLAYLHNDFHDLTVTLSADRSTVTSVMATVNNGAINYWVLHYGRPPHPSLFIHEFLGYVSHDYITLETTILPVPPTTYVDRFTGHWQRVRSCWICKFPYQKPSVFPYCWFDWLVIGIVVLAGFVVIRLVWRKRQVQQSDKQ